MHNDDVINFTRGDMDDAPRGVTLEYDLSPVAFLESPNTKTMLIVALGLSLGLWAAIWFGVWALITSAPI
jgi:hypothetical protein